MTILAFVHVLSIKTEAPFKEAQFAVLIVFLVLTILATIKSRTEPVQQPS